MPTLLSLFSLRAVGNHERVQVDRRDLPPVRAAEALRRASAAAVLPHPDAAVAEGGAVPLEQLAARVVDARAAAVALAVDDVRAAAAVAVRQRPAERRLRAEGGGEGGGECNGLHDDTCSVAG